VIVTLSLKEILAGTVGRNSYYGYGSGSCSTAQKSYDFVEQDYPFTGKKEYTIEKLEVYQCNFES